MKKSKNKNKPFCMSKAIVLSLLMGVNVAESLYSDLHN